MKSRIDAILHERYLDLVLPKMAEGGLIVCDNLLWKGEVARRSGGRSMEAVALEKFNRRIMSDPRLTSVVLPLSDGVGVSVVRQGVRSSGRGITASRSPRLR